MAEGKKEKAPGHYSGAVNLKWKTKKDTQLLGNGAKVRYLDGTQNGPFYRVMMVSADDRLK